MPKKYKNKNCPRIQSNKNFVIWATKSRVGNFLLQKIFEKFTLPFMVPRANSVNTKY